MNRVINYLNPMRHLGDRRYPIFFPLFTNIILCVISEIFANQIARDPNSVGVYIIFLNVFLIIYFAFRCGIQGGIISSTVAIIYYLYIIITRHYTGDQLTTSVETIIILGFLYLLVGGLIGWLKISIDKLIERESDAKRRLETIIEQLPMGVIITDSEGKVTKQNKQLNTILGYSLPSGFRIGKDVPEYIKINGKSINPSDSPLAKSLGSGKPVIGKEFIFHNKNGKKIIIQVTSAPIHNNKGDTIAAVSLITDITQKKEMENQKDEFLSMAAHELKTPITSINMFLDLMENEIDQNKIKKSKYYNLRLKDQVERLRELTDDLLDVTRIQTGKLILNKSEFEVTEIIKNTVEDLQATTQKNKIIFKPTKNITILGDRYRIYQVLINLINNAIKYSPSETDIIIKAESNSKNIIISIKDAGIGIEKSEFKRIFNKLYQVGNPREKTFPGLGLGLYISKEIVERHNGKIWLNSSPGKGTTFFFSLPLK